MTEAITVTEEMIAAAESVEDLYRRGTPDTWRKVYLAMSRAAQQPAPDCRDVTPQEDALLRNAALRAGKKIEKPDCRTCQSLHEGQRCIREVHDLVLCTNGDQYQPAPAVVLWRTE